jgi:hypothetical protein
MQLKACEAVDQHQIADARHRTDRSRKERSSEIIATTPESQLDESVGFRQIRGRM